MRRCLAIVVPIALAALSVDATVAAPAREPVRFTSGDFILEGDLLLPEGPPPYPAVVYVWGGGPTDRNRHIDGSLVLQMFLDEGFAVFLWDKPGSGGSSGEWAPGRLFDQRAAILVDALGLLRAHPAIRPDAIGLYGSSQAAYVLGLALQRTTVPAFLIAWSCPMQDSVMQGAYLVRNFALCAGLTAGEAERAGRAYLDRGQARTYAEYLAAARVLAELPAIRDDLGWAAVAAEADFTPADPASESFLDPGVLLDGRLAWPVLALFAEHDRQIDPVQGAAVVGRLIGGREDGLSAVVTVPGADHNMILSPRGCMQDQRDGYAAVGGRTIAPFFIDTIRGWLRRLGPALGGDRGAVVR